MEETDHAAEDAFADYLDEPTEERQHAVEVEIAKLRDRCRVAEDEAQHWLDMLNSHMTRVHGDDASGA